MKSDDRIRELFVPWTDVDSITIERRAAYRFHARTVNRFSVDRVFLVGDAAYITPPSVGQGLAVGLRDAINLSWELVWALQGWVDARTPDTYDEEHCLHAKVMINLTRSMGKLMMPRSAPTTLLTHDLMRLTQLVPGLRSQLEELHTKPKSVFKTRLFVKGCSSTKLIHGGVIPQGWVRNAEGHMCLSGDALGHGYTLVSLGYDTYATPESATTAVFERPDGVLVRIAHRGQSLYREASSVRGDFNGTLLPGAIPVGWAAVVCPDYMVAHDGPAAEASRLVCEDLALLGGRSESMAAVAAIAVAAVQSA